MVDDGWVHQENTTAGEAEAFSDDIDETRRKALNTNARARGLIDDGEDLIDEYRGRGFGMMRGLQSWAAKNRDDIDDINVLLDDLEDQLDNGTSDASDEAGYNRRTILGILGAVGLGGGLVYAGSTIDDDTAPTPQQPQPSGDGDQDQTERRPDFYADETWSSGLETMTPAQYTDFVDDDTAIIDICKEYQESRFEEVASIGGALSKDSNDIILDEEGQNLGEDLAISWWDRDDILNDTDIDELPEDIEGIVALNDWQKNVYEFSVLNENEYDFAVDVAKDQEHNYSLQNSADPMEYLAGGNI